MKKNRTVAMAESTSKLRNLIVQQPDLNQDEIMKALRIGSQASLYSLLLGLNQDEEICANGEFRIFKDGQHLTIDDIDDFFNNNLHQENAAPKLAERLLYLYWHLHNAIPDGGLTLEAITNTYDDLFSSSQGFVSKPETLRRMIYRDIAKFRELGIVIDNLGPKHCLRDPYLPKLSAESAATVYVSMLLYRDTLLDQATLCVREQLEKTFFKGSTERSRILNERIHVLGDTLANPQEFGNNLGKLIRAVGESFRIKIGYINNEGRKSERLLEPLGLVCKRSVWYLVAREVKSGENRTFRVDQIMSLSVRDSEVFKYPADFSVAEYIGCSWGVFNNDRLETVRLKFSPQVARRVKNLHYHPSQKIAEECPDGSVVLEFEVCGLLEMQSWILQWGTAVEVLEPVDLREDIREIAMSVAEKYRAKNIRKLRRV